VLDKRNLNHRFCPSTGAIGNALVRWILKLDYQRSDRYKDNQNSSQILCLLTDSRINKSQDTADKYLTCLPLYRIIILGLKLDTMSLQLKNNGKIFVAKMI